MKNDEHVITVPSPRRNGLVKEIDYLRYDFKVDVTDFVIFFRDYSDQHVVLTLFNKSIILVEYDQSFNGVYTSEHVLHKIHIGNKILFTRGYQVKTFGKLQDLIIVIDKNDAGVTFMRQY